MFESRNSTNSGDNHFPNAKDFLVVVLQKRQSRTLLGLPPANVHPEKRHHWSKPSSNLGRTKRTLKILGSGPHLTFSTSPEDLKEHKSFSVPQEESVEMKEFFQKPKGPPELIESNLQRQLSQLNLNETDSITSRETAQTKITSLPADMLHRLDKTYDLQITRSQEAILDRIKKDLKVFRNYKDLNDEENDSLIEEH